jgi:hypothetical protein
MLKKYFAILFILLSQFANAAGEVVQSFTFDGRLYSDAAGTTPMNDPSVSMKFQILNPAQTCILYEETQTGINTVTSIGFFTVQVGTATGSPLRTSGDSNHLMQKVYSNTGGVISGKLVADGVTACNYTPSSGDLRYVRMTVTPSLTGTPNVLSPDMPLESVPFAIIAEKAESVSGLPVGTSMQSATNGQLLIGNGTGFSIANLTPGSGINITNSAGGITIASTGSGTFDGLSAATGISAIDNTLFAQTWDWSTASTQNALTLTANSLTTGSVLSATTSGAGLNSTNGLLYIANTGVSTSGTVARIQSNSTAGSGLTVLANGNVGIGTTTPATQLEVIGDASVGLGPSTSTTNSVDPGVGGTVLNVVSTAGYPTNGYIVIDDEIIKYSSLNATQFLGLTRGTQGTAAAVHTAGKSVHSLIFEGRSQSTDMPLFFMLGNGSMGLRMPGSNVSFQNGSGSFASGSVGTKASGPASIASGALAVAGGGYSQAFGYQVTSGSGAANFTTAIGHTISVSADLARAIGAGLNASSFSDVVVGSYNNTPGGTAGSWVATDPIFEIGNGPNSGSRSNAMTVLKNGNVGIGTTAPGSKLHIPGTGVANGITFDAATLNSNDASTLGFNFAGTDRWKMTSSMFYTQTGLGPAFVGGTNLSILPKYSDATVGLGWLNTGVLTLFAGSSVTPSLTIDNGKVGIGTTAPVDTLSIGTAPPASTTNSLINLSNTALSGASGAGTFIGANPGVFTGDFLNFQVGGANQFKVDYDGTITTTGSYSSNGFFNIYHSSTGTTPNDVLRAWTTDTATVGSPVSMSPRVRLGGVAWDSGTVASKTFWGALELMPVTGNPASSYLRFGMDPGTGTYSYPMVITSAGKVGIGTTTPISTLTVAGDITTTSGMGSMGSGNTAYLSSSASELDPIQSGTSTAYIQAYNTSSADGYGAYNFLAVRNANSNLQKAYIGGISTSGAGSYSPAIVMGYSTGATAYNERLRIKEDGKFLLTGPLSTLTIDLNSSSTYPLISTGLTRMGFVNGISIEPYSSPFISFKESGVAQRGVIGFPTGSSSLVYRGGGSDFLSGTEFFRINSSGNVGLSNAAPSTLLHVGSASVGSGLAVANFQNIDGTCTITPASSGSGIACSSDERLKENFKSVDGEFALDRLLKLQAVTYNFKTAKEAVRRTGYKAQEVQKIAPEFVRQNEDGFYQIYYDGFIPWITEAMKTIFGQVSAIEKENAVLLEKVATQEKEIQQLKSENELMKSRMSHIEEMMQQGR